MNSKNKLLTFDEMFSNFKFLSMNDDEPNYEISVVAAKEIYKFIELFHQGQIKIEEAMVGCYMLSLDKTILEPKIIKVS